MIVTVFRWRLKPDTFDRFSQGWEAVTRYYLDRGSLGSSLFREKDDLVWAIARWPDLSTREAAFAEPAPTTLRLDMLDCILERIEPVELETASNLWV